MNFNNLEVFIKVVEYGSFARTADALFTSYQNVARNISALENETGTKLLIRNNKGIKLTYNGEQFYDFAKRTVNELDSLKMSFKEKNEVLRIGVDDHILDPAATQLLNFISNIIQFTIVPKPFNMLDNLLKNDEIDCYFSPSKNTSKDIHFSLIKEKQIGIILNINHRLADRKSVSIADLDYETIHSGHLDIRKFVSINNKIEKLCPNARVVNGKNLINTLLLLHSNRIDAMIIESINIPVVLHSKYEYLSDREKANLSMLRSLGGLKKLEIFYIDFEGHILDNKINKAIEEIQKIAVGARCRRDDNGDARFKRIAVVCRVRTGESFGSSTSRCRHTADK